MINEHMPFIWYGGDYNPDQWDEKTIEEDMRLFKKAGINLVTLPVFSWAKLEPSEGVYNFEWLDEIMDKLWENGIHVCMATPTTAQPAWLSKKYPEVLPVDIAGRKRTHGMRVFFCVNSEKYRERAAAIAEEMAKRYKDHPALAAWHVANEYGTYCYCENCQRKFRIWLKERYKTIENLNEKWNTAFWGRIVYDFDEIMLPTELNDDYRFNPAIQLDYMRFVTASTKECFENEASVLRRYTPDIPVFSNISGYIKKLDQFTLTENMDCAGWDNYPTPGDPVSIPALKHDIMRALKDGKPYIITEQSPNQQNWQPYNKLKRPGEVRALAYQGIARGGDACLFFQMRQSIGGQEKFHGAVISHAGREDTRIFREISDLGAELGRLGDICLDGRTDAKVGFLFDWDNWWALELTSGPTKDMDYLAQVHKYYKAFYEKNIQTDILKVTSDFSKYKIIVAPLLYMMKEGLAEKLESFVENGGILAATYMTGLADENDRCIFGAYPGKLRKLMGLWVEETDALFPEERNSIIIRKKTKHLKGVYSSGFLCDILHPETAEVIGEYGKDFYEGTPCVTKNVYGKGAAYYLGTEPDEEFLEDFVTEICEEAGVHPLLESEGRVEICARENQKGQVIFLINHEQEPAFVKLGADTYENLLTGKTINGTLQLNSKDVAVLKKR
ncbi:MAG TPA: beta-galactosidase [Candidatus Blautia faecigallinarum]|uniref:Beta-galactosidase n=1 Tax=Candidatus Blautia faecigallinarum TaxID=2838488 RepID=A0A9D2DQX6_9FIRM|nr:beta-galactosidase [Candidatus Blautia faecigallinarum]